MVSASSAGDSARRAPRLFVLFARQQAGVDGNERGGEHAFAEQVLQEIGDAEGGPEGVRRVGIAEVVREDAVADQAGDAAQEDSGGHQKRVLPGFFPGRRGCSGACHGCDGQGVCIESRRFMAIVSETRVARETGAKSKALSMRCPTCENDTGSG